MADQSHYRSVFRAGYVPFKRDMMLNVLKNGVYKGVTNTILLDYYRHLQDIENDTAAFRTKLISDWDGLAWKGFFQELQKVLNGNWKYVHNQSGGFWGF